VALWNLRTLQPEPAAPSLGTNNIGLRFSPDGALLAVGSQDGRLKIWSAVRECVLTNLSAHPTPVLPLCFSADGRLLVTSEKLTGAPSAAVTVWETDTWRRRATWKVRGWAGFVPSAALSRDRQKLVTAGNPQVSDLETGAARWLGGKSGLPEVCWATLFSHDGGILAGGCTLGDVRLFDPATELQTGSIQGECRMVESLAFSPDDRCLAVAGIGPCPLTVWNVATWREVLRLCEAEKDCPGCWFSADGNTLIAALAAPDLGQSRLRLRLWMAPSFNEIAGRERSGL
jgi:hypothetical protein